MKRKLFWANVDSRRYARKRIPGMIVTSKGTILAYYEARTAGSDWARMDILCQRSTDGGALFDAPIVLARGSDAHPTVNNPVMMEDRNNRIHFLYCEDYGTCGGRILRRYSDDDGMTWSDVADITDVTLPHYRNAFALGPGHGICTASGMLLVPVWMVPKYCGEPVQSHHPSSISTLFSLDDGETWQLGEILSPTPDVLSPSETVAAELSDGRIYLSIRQDANCRCKAIGRTGFSLWETYGREKALIDPICFGSVVSVDHAEYGHLLLFVNCESVTDRKNVVLKCSTDDGATWTHRIVIDTDHGGYTEIAADAKCGMIYLLYEESFGEALHFAKLKFSELFGSV